MGGVTQTHKDALDEFVRLSMWKHGTPGLVLGVTDSEGDLVVSAYGVSDFGSMRPMSADMLFQIGSVSKSFTCIALLQLAEEGLIDLQSPVKDYLQWFSVLSSHSEITLHHLMTHTAGIIMGTDATPTGYTEVWDLRHTEATVEPGSYFHYSNSGYKALGLVLEAVLGDDYENIIRSRVLDAVGMVSSEPVMTNGIRPRLATAHSPMHDDRQFKRGDALVPATWFESDTADGSICSDVRDMLAYVRMLLNGGETPGRRVLSEEAFRRMTTPYITPEDGLHPGGYGYGLNIETVDGHKHVSHSGGMVGYYTSMVMDMGSRLGAVAMINGPGAPEDATRAALDLFRAVSAGADLPACPSEEDALRVQRAEDYTGTYAGPDGRLDVKETDGTLTMKTERGEAALEPIEEGMFLARIPGFELFLVETERGDREVERVHVGPRTYDRDATETSPTEETEEQKMYAGHFRSHNPWLTNFRIVTRMDGLAFVYPEGRSEPLTPVGHGLFRIGKDARSPERICFDTVVDGVAMAATLSGGGRFGRTFTP